MTVISSNHANLWVSGKKLRILYIGRRWSEREWEWETERKTDSEMIGHWVQWGKWTKNAASRGRSPVSGTSACVWTRVYVQLYTQKNGTNESMDGRSDGHTRTEMQWPVPSKHKWENINAFSFSITLNLVCTLFPSNFDIFSLHTRSTLHTMYPYYTLRLVNLLSNCLTVRNTRETDRQKKTSLPS